MAGVTNDLVFPSVDAKGDGPFIALLSRRTQLSSAFQPIVALRDECVLGYEALLRLAPGGPFRSPEDVFRAAVGTPWLVDVEMAALDVHLSAARRLPQGRLFLNFSAPAFADNRMKATALSARVLGAGLRPERVVLELTELVQLADPARFAALLGPLRQDGFLVAVDDFGAGFTNLQLLVELGPDFVKIDRSLIDGAGRHPRKRAFLESLGALGRRINCDVIAEGVESREDLAAVRACGIGYAQGRVIGSPEPVSHWAGYSRGRLHPAHSVRDHEEPVGALCVPQEGIPPEYPAGLLVPLLERHPLPTAVPVLAGGRPVGLVTAALLLHHLGHRYGHSLWHDRPVAEFLALEGGGYDSLAACASLEEAADLVRRRPARRRFDPLVVVTEHGDYHGLLPIDLLLSEITRLKVELALQANPLTGLPGSVALGKAVMRRLADGVHFALGWVDIDNFKPFNDRYGFGRGDEVLLLLSEVLRKRMQWTPLDQIMHLGGDDFAFVADDADVEERAWAVAHDFSERVPALYDAEDRAAGGFVSHSRQGVPTPYGIISVSIGIVVWRGESGVGFRHLAETAAEVKHRAKAEPGPAVAVNARALGSSSGGEADL